MQVTGDLTFLLNSQKGTSVIDLQAGAVVKAQVKDVTAQEVLLLIRGQTIVAKTETSLEPGQRVDLRVQEFEAGRIVFQIINEEPVVSSRQVSTKPTAEALLARYGLPTSPGNLLLAQALLRTKGEELSRDGFLLLSKSLSSNPSLAEAQALLQLYSKGISLEKNHVTALQAFIEFFSASTGSALTGEGDWQSLLKSVINLQEGGNLWEGLSIASGEERTIADQLAHLQERLGLDYEARLKSTLLQRDFQDNKTNPTIKEALLSMLQRGTSEGVAVPETLQAARMLLQALTGLQLLHLGRADEGQFYLMGLLNWNTPQREQEPFFLSFFQDQVGGQGPGEPSRQVMLKTSTPRLGPILAEMRFYRGQMSIEVLVEKQETQQLFNKYLGKLLEMMEDLPWRTQVLPCRIETGEKETGQWLQKFLEPQKPQRLDVLL